MPKYVHIHVAEWMRSKNWIRLLCLDLTDGTALALAIRLLGGLSSELFAQLICSHSIMLKYIGMNMFNKILKWCIWFQLGVSL